ICKLWNTTQQHCFASQHELTWFIDYDDCLDELLEGLVTTEYLQLFSHLEAIRNGVIKHGGCTCYFDHSLKCKSDDVINMTACHFVVDHFTNLQALQLVMGNVIYRPAFEFLLENLGPNLKRLDIAEYCDEGERMDWIVDAIRVT